MSNFEHDFLAGLQNEEVFISFLTLSSNYGLNFSIMHIFIKLHFISPVWPESVLKALLWLKIGLYN